MCFVVPGEWKHCTKLTQLVLCHFSVRAHSTFDLLMSEEGPKGVRITGTFLLLIIFTICFKEATQGRKDLIIFLGHSCFLEITAFFLYAKQVLVSKENMDPWRLSALSQTGTTWYYLHESQWIPTLRIHQILCPWGTGKAIYKWGDKE